MKLNISSIILSSILLISFGCGPKMSSTSKKSSAQSTLMNKHGVQTVAAPSEYSGSWVGQIDSDLATIEISPNGSIQFEMQGKVIKEKLVKDSKNIFYMTDTIDNQLIKIESQGHTLIFHASDEDIFYFSRK